MIDLQGHFSYFSLKIIPVSDRKSIPAIEGDKTAFILPVYLSVCNALELCENKESGHTTS